MKAKTKNPRNKRYGTHQRRSKHFHKVYLPYLPLVIAIVGSVIISGWSPRRGTLAYATNMSISGLLQATNSQRSANGQAALTVNSQLNSAAQAKANDMVARNYWSHNTPDGQEPWVFVEATGYKYLKAGENLAYGFLTSDEAVVGWMNSPSHKANMLDSAFSEVGFGYANSSNYNDSGPETVVVAMYGKPQTLAASAQQPAAPAPVTQAAPPASTPQSPAAAPTPTPTQPSETATEQNPAKEDTKVTPAFSTDSAGLEPIQQSVTRVEALSGGQAPWIAGGISVLLAITVIIMLLKHGIGLRRLIRDSESFVLHHPLFDSVVLSIIIVAVTLLQTVGFTL